jgi:hypothetical protein
MTTRAWERLGYALVSVTVLLAVSLLALLVAAALEAVL